MIERELSDSLKSFDSTLDGVISGDKKGVLRLSDIGYFNRIRSKIDNYPIIKELSLSKNRFKIRENTRTSDFNSSNESSLNHLPKLRNNKKQYRRFHTPSKKIKLKGDLPSSVRSIARVDPIIFDQTLLNVGLTLASVSN